MEDIRKKLFEMQDEKYRDFHSSLCPNVNDIIGVRIPNLRKLAKQIANENAKEFLENTKKEYYEEKMLQGFVIGYMKADLNERLKHLDSFVHIIDNWAVCDCSCSTFKFTNQSPKEVWEYLQKYICSNREFELRFAIVMIMDYYITNDYIDKVLEIYNNIHHDGYYVKMAVAWALSVCYVKFPEKTMSFLKNNNLDNFTYNKAIQKMIESYRIDEKTKDILRKLKRK